MMALAFSGGKDSMACLHLMRESLDCAVYVDTGFSYPETRAMVDYAATLVPMHVVKSDRIAQNTREGIPADIVPINWTAFGQSITHEKPVKVQGYLGCCFENIMYPLYAKLRELGADYLVYGQRSDESHRAPIRDGHIIDGVTRLHPIEGWTSDQVIEYLRQFMEIPAHYALKHSSLDCYDCTAYRAESKDRVTWTREHHPKFYEEYTVRASALDSALSEAMHG